MPRVLNVGGGSKRTPLPPHYAGFEHVLLDIDPRGRPDIVCDARTLARLEAAQFEAVYCSHNLEHYYRHDVPRVLSGFLHVLKDGWFAQIRVPDLAAVMRAMAERELDLEDTLYTSPAGPITALDVFYGYGREIEGSGQDFYAHKTGFTAASLRRTLEKAGFSQVHLRAAGYELNALAVKGDPDPAARALLKLPRQ
ncbi:MAG: class I SAM-dependent methyltransferase [Hyphomonadaceae bacterium]